MKSLFHRAILGALLCLLASCDGVRDNKIVIDQSYKGIDYHLVYAAVVDKDDNIKYYRRVRTYYIKRDGSIVIVPDASVPAPQVLPSEAESTPDSEDGGEGNTAVSLQSPGAYLLNNAGDNAIVVLDKLTKLIATTIPVSSYMSAITASPNGRLVVVAQRISTGAQLLLVDVATNRVTRTVPLPANTSVASLNFSPDSQTLYVANDAPFTNASSILVMDAASWTLRSNVPAQNPSGNLTKSAISPNGQLIFVKAGINVAIFDTLTNTWAGNVSTGNVLLSGSSIAFSPNGNEVYLDTPQGLAVIDVATATVVANISGGSQLPARRLLVAPGGEVAILVYEDRLSRIDLASKKLVGTSLIEANHLFDWAFLTPG